MTTITNSPAAAQIIVVRTYSRFSWFAVLVWSFALASCSNDKPTSPPALELPPIPTLSVEQLSDEVREKFTGIQQQLKSTPLDGHYNARFARLLHAYSLHAPAAVMYQRCRLLRPNDLDCIYLEALTLRLLGNNEAATELLTTLLERKPDFPRASVVLADTYRQQGLTEQAVPLFQKAVNARRGDLEAVYGLAVSLQELGDLPQAKVLLNSLHTQGRNFGIVHAALATIHRQEGRPEEAAFSAALASRFADSKIPFVDSALWAVQDELVGDQRLVREARTLFAKGSLKEAADAYVKAAQADPGNASNHNSLIGIYGQLGYLAGSQHHFERAREINPTDVVPLVAMGTVHMKRGAFAAARDNFAEAIKLQPSHSEARTLKTYCSQLLGEPIQPEELRRALRDDPTQALAHYLLARHLANTENCTEALPHFNSSIRLESAQTPAFVSELVRCLVETGDFEKAREQLAIGKSLAQHYRNRNALRALEQVATEFASQLAIDTAKNGGS